MKVTKENFKNAKLTDLINFDKMDISEYEELNNVKTKLCFNQHLKNYINKLDYTLIGYFHQYDTKGELQEIVFVIQE